MRRFWISLVLILTLVLGACSSPTSEPTAVEDPTEEPAETVEPAEEETVQISVAGSTTVQPLAELLAEAFISNNPNVAIDVQGGGSSVGVKSAAQNTVDVGMASREVKDSELEEYPEIRPIAIAYDGIAIAAHSDVEIDGLTLQQVRDIFAGNVTNWSEVGGPDATITVVSREEGSGTRAAFEDMVMGEELIADTAILQPSNGSVRTTVSTTPDSIGYLSFGYLDDSVKALEVDDTAPTPANASNGAYPVVRPLNMITSGEPSDVVQGWLDFIFSAEGQAIVAEEGYIPVPGSEESEEMEEEEEAAGYSGEISVAGSTTVQPLAELFTEAFMEMYPDVAIDVQGGGSSVGVKSAAQNTVDVGMASREVKDSELEEYPEIRPIAIAYDGIAIAAHSDVEIDGLTLQQVRDIFAGNVTNWSEVGGPDATITVVSREEGSGTRAAFEDMVMGEELIADTAILQPSNGSVRTTVSTTPDSIGYLSFGYLDDSVKALEVDDTAPTPANASNGAYPVVRPLNMITSGEPSDVVQGWLDFIFSAEGQEIVAAEGYIPIE